ncbi:hypothetical protein FS837_003937, partial [Tulasnella sp. UAMH 9824]
MWEATFAPVIQLLEEHAGLFAFHTAWEEMERSLNYTAEIVEIPGGDLTNWVNNYVPFSALHRQSVSRQGPMKKTTTVSIGSVEKSVWLRNPQLDTSRVAPVTLEHVAHERRIVLPSYRTSNPLETIPTIQKTPPPATRTVASQEVYRQTQAALKFAIKGIQTQEQLDTFMKRMEEIEANERADLQARQPVCIRDPPVLNPKGHPRTARLAASHEGGGRKGGGAGKVTTPPRRNPKRQRQPDADIDADANTDADADTDIEAEPSALTNNGDEENPGEETGPPRKRRRC